MSFGPDAFRSDGSWLSVGYSLGRTVAGTVFFGPLRPSRAGVPPTSVATLGPAAALSSSLGWLAEAALGAALRPRKASSAGGSLRAAGYRIIGRRSEEHTSELQSLMRISYAVFCLKKKTTIIQQT